MQSQADSADAGPLRKLLAGQWSAAVLSGCWAATGAVLALWVFRAWEHPVPAFNPNDGPIGPDSNLSFWVGGCAMGLPLAAFTVALAAIGSRHVSKDGRSARVRTAWVVAVAAAVVLEAVFIGTFMAPGKLFGIAPGQANWALLVLAALFVAVGGAKLTILFAAGFRPRAGAGAGLRG
jgi:hypothetical protein